MKGWWFQMGPIYLHHKWKQLSVTRQFGWIVWTHLSCLYCPTRQLPPSSLDSNGIKWYPLLFKLLSTQLVLYVILLMPCCTAQRNTKVLPSRIRTSSRKSFIWLLFKLSRSVILLPVNSLEPALKISESRLVFLFLSQQPLWCKHFCILLSPQLVQIPLEIRI